MLQMVKAVLVTYSQTRSGARLIKGLACFVTKWKAICSLFFKVSRLINYFLFSVEDIKIDKQF